MSKSMLANVYEVFKDLTGLDWYPDPSAINNEFWQDAVEQVDDIIAAQAKGLGKAHCTAQNDTKSELVSEAKKLFLSFSAWAVEVMKLQTGQVQPK